MIEISSSDFIRLCSFLRERYGLDLKDKKILVEGRLRNYVLEQGFPSFHEYFQQMYEDRSLKEIHLLLDKITTNHTFFMRESMHFDFFRKVVLPHIEATVRDKDFRIWSAGCSSGEEAYTLAMIIDDYFGERGSLWNLELLATDISDRVLAKARVAVYPAESLSGIPAEYKFKYFVKHPKGFQVVDKLRQRVVLRKFNLMEDSFPFRKPFHVVFCRNVMIYFDKESKDKLVHNFYDYTVSGGYLFIGHSEFIEKGEGYYRSVIPSVYVK